jgi:hypothetical protein
MVGFGIFDLTQLKGRIASPPRRDGADASTAVVGAFLMSGVCIDKEAEAPEVLPALPHELSSREIENSIRPASGKRQASP